MRTRITLLILGALVAVVLAACGSSSSSDDADTAAAASADASTASASDVDLSGVTLRVGDIAKVTKPVFDFAKLGDTPYKLEWSTFDAAPPLIKALVANAIDLGQAGEQGLVLAQASGVPFKVVAGVRLPPASFRIVVGKDSDITSLKDLKGKKVGVFKGSSGHGYLLAALEEAGLDSSDITVVDVTPPQGAAALSGGSIDAWAIWEPFVSSIEIASGAKSLPDSNSYHALSFFTTTQTVLDDPKKAAAIKDFLDRYQRANKYVHEHPEEWAADYAKVTGLPANVAESAAPSRVQSYEGLTPEIKSAYGKTTDDFLAAGLIKEKPADIDAIFADGVAPPPAQ